MLAIEGDSVEEIWRSIKREIGEGKEDRREK